MQPRVFAGRLAKHLSGASFWPSDVRKAQRALRRCRDRRHEPAGRKGYEYVVERLLRPVVEDSTAAALKVPRDKLYPYVYSSHFHTTDDPDWKARWAGLKKAHPQVDVRDRDGHSRRADLFIDAGHARLVSIEFKYVQPNRTPSITNCVRQLRLYLRRHAATVLVVYAGTPSSVRLAAAVRETGRRVSKRAFVVLIEGPPIQF